jgi:methyl-accepting chemotaxis protein
MLRNLSVLKRLLLSFSALALLMMVLGLTSWAVAGSQNEAFNRFNQSVAKTLVGADEAWSSILNSRRYEKDVILASGHPALTKEARTRWDQEQKKLASALESLKTLTDAGTAEQLRIVESEMQGYAALARPVLDNAAAGILSNVTEANDALKGAVVQADRAEAALLQARASVERFSQQLGGEVSSLYRVFTIVIAALLLVSVLAVALLGWRVSVSVVQPVTAATRFATQVSQGDLTVQIHPQGRDEVTALQRALGAMQVSLQQMVGQIRQSTDSISTASAEIATGNQDLSNRTEQTASNLQQTASSMEQLTGTVKQSADSARQANQLAASAAEVAARGGSVVSQVVSTMDEITASSKKINDIIGVIDGIAFQTNILALNAAVEAARAGEQGRGFAVVASEVRNLAQRSAQAAREIKGLIGASVEKVESGSRLVADAGATMNEIVGSVQRVSDIIGEITAASSEQSDGIGQVNSAVTQLDQMTQQNAALVEESAAAAQSLKEQAKRLAEVVSVFKLTHA